MDLRDFVSETLQQIINGVKAAQAVGDGGNVNAGGVVSSGHLLSTHVGLFTRVDFDVAVTAETTGGGKASLKVWSIGAEGGAEHKSQTASRVQFSVPVRLPDGDQTKVEERKAKWDEAMNKGKERTGGPQSWMER